MTVFDQSLTGRRVMAVASHHFKVELAHSQLGASRVVYLDSRTARVVYLDSKTARVVFLDFETEKWVNFKPKMGNCEEMREWTKRSVRGSYKR